MATAAEYRDRLKAIAERLRDMSPIMEVVAQDTRTLIDDSFNSQTSPEGQPWAALSETTIAINPRRAGGKPLNDTTRLRRSITTETTRSGFRFGTNVGYAATHQFGRPDNRVFGGARGPIPARPFLPVAGIRGSHRLMRGGAAGAHWARVRTDIAHWLRTGEFR
jgi:phage virion morphogenesis protein